MAHVATRETELLEPIFAKYEAEGFDVFVHPTGALLPGFMGNYRPDAIAVRPGKKIAIEVKHSTRGPAGQLGRLQELFSRQTEWELAVLYVSPRSHGDTINIATPLAIEEAIAQVEQITGTGQFAAALVLGWSTLEAIARSLLPTQLARPQPPVHLVEVLATEGLITPTEADALRSTASLRNTAAHGQLDVSLNSQLLGDLISVLRALSALPPKRRRTSS